jgi:membrane protein
VGMLARLVVIKLAWDRWRARRQGAPRLGRGPPAAPAPTVPAGTRTIRSSAAHLRDRAPGEQKVDPRVTPDSPLDLPAEDWKQTLKRTLAEVKQDRVTFAAAAIAYYLFLAIFPALIALVGILGIAHIDASGLIDSLSARLPGGAGRALTRAISGADNPSQAASLTAAITGIAIALWSASSGMAALQTGLNVAYDVPAERKFVAKRAVALVLLLATLVLGGVPSPFFTFGESVIFTVLGWILTVAAVVVLFSIYYYLGPNRDSPTWKWLTTGGTVGTALWIMASLLFGYYVSTFNNYGKTYGPLAGVIVLVLWLYLSAIAVLLGAELNAEFERQARLKEQRS